MLVKAMTGFRDLEANVFRKAGERFEVSRERFDAINGTRYGQLVAEVPTERPKRRTRKEG